MEAPVVPLAVILGPTASGKTALAIELAKQFNGEIIAADSRTIYKGMDIGTAKPTLEEQQGVPHHLLSIINPDQRYSAAQFKTDANRLISDIHKRGKLPIIVGGTGLYIDAVLYDYQFSSDNTARNLENPRHLDKSTSLAKSELRPRTVVIGLDPGREVLLGRIEARVHAMMENGFEDEVRGLLDEYGSDNEAMSGIGYRTYVRLIRGEITRQEAIDEFIRGDKSLAKRQRTWFKRNKSIHWVYEQREAVELVTTLLAQN